MAETHTDDKPQGLKGRILYIKQWKKWMERSEDDRLVDVSKFT